MAKASSAVGGADPAVVEQIHTSQVPPRTQKWDFPTMEDFAKVTILDGRDGAKPNRKRSMAHADGNDASPATKIKSEIEAEHGDASDM
jgi:hypothetical protein